MLFQPVTHVASVSCGLYLKKGSVDELSNEAGFFHFVEHMLFKGTKTRSAKAIVETVERVGGIINAVTSREYTSYYISLIRDEMELALDILADMIQQPLFKTSDINLERSVIIEEIKSYEDSPEDYLYDSYYESYFNKAAIGKNIAGTIESVSSVNKEKLERFYQKHYHPSNLILSVSGNTSLKELQPLVDKFFLKGFEKNKIFNPKTSYPTKSKQSKDIGSDKSYKSKSAYLTNSESKENQDFSGDPSPLKKNFEKVLIKRKIEQVNFYMGAEGFARTNENTPALILASNILGGGMSSRLFQEVREKLGLCYSIQCFPSSYKFVGMTSIFCATSPNKTNLAIDVILKEIDKILKKGFKKDELEHSRSNLIGSLAMGYELSESRMNNIAIQEIYYGRFFSLMDRIKIFSKIDLDSLNDVFRKVYQLEKYHLSAIGDLNTKDFASIPNFVPSKNRLKLK
ncbi:MAG: insulinase family protein [Leptospiraceae bacterium]|nr:insulinase family protein [Leptospiraceae bacterium]